MSQSLDLYTVLSLHKLSFFVTALCFLYVRFQSPESRGLGLLSAGFFLAAAGSVFAGLAWTFADYGGFLRFVGMLTGLEGYAVFLMGIARISDRRSGKSWQVTLFPVVVVAPFLFSDAYAEAGTRIIVFTLASALLLAVAAYLVFADRKTEPLPARSVLAAVIALTAGLNLLVAIVTSPHDAYNVASRDAFFASIVCHFTIAIFVMALVKERAEAGLRKLADLDMLTGLKTRGAFFSRLPQVMRQGDAVAMIDIDHFKRINDEFGHLAGDEVLASVARELSRHIRAEDSLARFGGEEFVLFMPLAGRQAAQKRVEAMRLGVKVAIHAVDGRAVSVTVSAGISICDMQAGAQSLLDTADIALYASKATGRDRVTVYSDGDRDERQAAWLRRQTV